MQRRSEMMTRNPVSFDGYENMKSLSRKVRSNNKGGVAVVIVIWIMVMLVALVGEFSYSMRTEIRIARNFKEEEEAYQLALAGIEKAKIEILSLTDLRAMYRDDNGTLILKPEENEETRNEKPAENDETNDRRGSLGKGEYVYTIDDEDGKLNLNTATQAQMKNIFLDSGVDIEDVDTIVDSILDWRDSNDLHRLNGAEEDYYQSLDRPYSCKDGNFSSVEELLLVKGMTHEILYGTKNKEEDGESKVHTGVARFFTVSGSNTININTAPAPVLEAVFGPDVADNILLQRVNGPVTRSIAKGKLDSQYFTLVSTGTNSDKSIKRTIKTTIQRLPDNLITRFWNDNYIE